MLLQTALFHSFMANITPSLSLDIYIYISNICIYNSAAMNTGVHYIYLFKLEFGVDIYILLYIK